jgi:hypothetical protein
MATILFTIYLISLSNSFYIVNLRQRVKTENHQKQISIAKNLATELFVVKNNSTDIFLIAQMKTIASVYLIRNLKDLRNLQGNIPKSEV